MWRTGLDGQARQHPTPTVYRFKSGRHSCISICEPNNKFVYCAELREYEVRPMEFSTEQIAELTGVTRRMLAHWDETNVLSPSGNRASGKGSKRRYKYSDLVAAGMIKHLREGKCPLPKIRAAVSHLLKHHPETEASETI